MKIVLFIFVLNLLGQSPVPEPPLDSECLSDWYFYWEFKEHPFCNEQEPFGDVYFYSCKIKKHSDYFGEYDSFKFIHQCIYTFPLEVPAQETKMVFLPVVRNIIPTIGQPIR
jgi:hypothetical protein